MRPNARMIAVVTAAVFLAFPGVGSSAPIISRSVQCSGVVDVGGPEVRCVQQFLVTDARFPSDIESHANFHARTARGTVTVEWFDEFFHLRARIVCESPGLYVQQSTPTGPTVGGGPADVSTYPTCRRTFDQGAKFARGIQTLVVRATAQECWGNDGGRSKCPFHGYLVLNRTVLPL